MSAQINEQSDLLYQIMGWAEEKPTIALLQALEQTGSINKAAQSMGIQYRTAWQKICQLNNLLPYPLLSKRIGGSGGGGSVLTEEGRKLLARIKLLRREFTQFKQFAAEDPQEALATIQTLRRIEMKLSARNVWLGLVAEIEQGVVNSAVHIRLKGGDRITSVITDASVKRLRLVPGSEVMAVVKASNILLGLNIDPQTVSARNILSGTITDIIPGAVNDEVTAELPGGSTVTSIITSASVKRLDLSIGKPISAVIKASDVLLAVA
ncbi:molybdate transport system regulatory protein [Candidatus Electrothrix marina]|uniref:Molybdate transport system regulatory protein n=1 Tax=Candidatus Electrothrix marina TaxID=1859130 RepID=A0A444IX99_9BACT|nr:molybdate transport system regulatory protein [Candidatus Electrothrix marina]